MTGVQLYDMYTREGKHDKVKIDETALLCTKIINDEEKQRTKKRIHH